MTIQQHAQALLEAKRQKEKQEADKKAENIKKALDKTMVEFEAAFGHSLEMLKASGISYTTHLKDPQSPDSETYIEFKLGDNSLMMDFIDRKNYRFFYTPISDDSSFQFLTPKYGVYPQDEFVMFIFTNLTEEGIAYNRSITF